MNKFKKIVRVMLISMLVMFFLTIVIAAIITFTSFKQSWSDEALICALSISTLIFSFLTAAILGRRGVLAGLCSSLALLSLFYAFIFVLFAGSKDTVSLSPYMLLPILFGMVGGVAGANNNK